MGNIIKLGAVKMVKSLLLNVAFLMAFVSYAHAEDQQKIDGFVQAFQMLVDTENYQATKNGMCNTEEMFDIGLGEIRQEPERYFSLQKSLLGFTKSRVVKSYRSSSVSKKYPISKNNKDFWLIDVMFFNPRPNTSEIDFKLWAVYAAKVRNDGTVCMLGVIDSKDIFPLPIN